MIVPPPLEQIGLTSPSGRLTATFVPAMGGEMTSLTVLHGDRRHELLHRGGDLSPADGWSGRAPHLWPVIGRTYPTGREPAPGAHKTAPLGWSVDGVLRPMPQHGFARSLPWRVDRRCSTRMRMVLEDGPETRRHYPFAFSLALETELTDAAIRLDYRVAAGPENTAAMPFTIGNHITFRVPLTDRASPEGTTVRCDATLRRPLDAIGCPSGPAIRDRSFQSPTPVTEIRPMEVVVLGGFEPRPASASLAGDDGVQVHISHAVDGSAAGAPLSITLWGDPPAGYLSLEPWLGLPNALSSGEGAVALAPGDTLRWIVDVSVVG